jgi:hypothetical protein
MTLEEAIQFVQSHGIKIVTDDDWQISEVVV